MPIWGAGEDGKELRESKYKGPKSRVFPICSRPVKEPSEAGEQWVKREVAVCFEGQIIYQIQKNKIMLVT